MELYPGTKLPPHDIAVEYRKLSQALFYDQSLGEEERDRLRIRKEELDKQYDFVFIPFTENGKMGLKCYTGEVIIEAKYDDFSLIYSPHEDDFPDKTIVAKKDGKCGIVAMDGSGKELTPFIYDVWKYCFDTYLVGIGGKCGIIHENNGREVVPCEFDEIREGTEFWAIYRNGLHGFVQYLGPGDNYLVTDVVYSDSRFNENNNLTVKLGDSWGFIDENGKFTTDEEKAFIKKDLEYEGLFEQICEEL